MKGMELCQRYFHEIGFPAIQRELPECVPYLAAGLGGGSQSHGNDDEVSRDHGWGPTFTVWLQAPLFERFATPLQAVLDRLPTEYLGYRWPQEEAPTPQVMEIGQYIKSLVGYETPPETELDWLHIPEEYLFEVTPDRLFHDAAREVTKRLEAFNYYPDDVWKKRLSAALAWLGEWGPKHLRRAERRGDSITASTYWTWFATYVMKVAFLLNHRYAPYHKWLYREFLKLPSLVPELDPLLRQGFAEQGNRISIVTQVEAIVARELSRTGYQPVVPTGDRLIKDYDNAFFHYAVAVHQSINAQPIRDLNRYVEICPPPTKTTWMYA